MYPSRWCTVLAALAVSSLLGPTAAQTYSSCNPLLQGTCPADPALGRSVDVDFTSGASDEFTAAGGPTYGADGAAFTVSQSGDAPSISSKWYIMFGHVEFEVKAAPGTGIVSAAILQSDCLDEIDWEWLGGDNTQAQSNYFGKGITTTGYNRGAFHGAPNNHDQFHTYSIDWTADQIVWSIDGTTVRAMTQDQAEPGQYPQTPMYVKVGAWAGGDPANPPGTIQWAGGITDYSAGPFTMYLKSIKVTDYSTGSQYSYSGTSGTWQSIVSSGGQINSQGNGSPVSSGTAPAVTSSVPDGAPLGFGNSNNDNASVLATRTGWPWTGTATATAVSPPPTSSSWPAWSPQSTSTLLETVTSYDEQGFPNLVTIDPAAPTSPKSYDDQGFLITTTTEAVTSPTFQPAETQLPTSTSGTESENYSTTLSTTSDRAGVAPSPAASTSSFLSTSSTSVQSDELSPSTTSSGSTTTPTSSVIEPTSAFPTSTSPVEFQSATPTTFSSTTNSQSAQSDTPTSSSTSSSTSTTTGVSESGYPSPSSSSSSTTTTSSDNPAEETSSSSSPSPGRYSTSSTGTSAVTEHHSTTSTTSSTSSTRLSTTLTTSSQSNESPRSSTSPSPSPSPSETPPAVNEGTCGPVLNFVHAIIATGFAILIMQ